MFFFIIIYSLHHLFQLFSFGKHFDLFYTERKTFGRSVFEEIDLISLLINHESYFHFVIPFQFYFF